MEMEWPSVVAITTILQIQLLAIIMVQVMAVTTYDLDPLNYFIVIKEDTMQDNLQQEKMVDQNPSDYQQSEQLAQWGTFPLLKVLLIKVQYMS